MLGTSTHLDEKPPISVPDAVDLPSCTFTVAFADIADSSRLYRELGELVASALITALLDRLTDEVTGAGGNVVDRIGDELMCTFADADVALAVAARISEMTRDTSRGDAADNPVLLRIGLDHGELLQRDGRIFGDCVYRAKRIVDLAKAGQIAYSAAVMAATSADHTHRLLDEITLKGQSATTRLYELLWDEINATIPGGRRLAPSTDARQLLRLEAPLGIVELPPGATLTIGRDAPSDLRVAAASASRLHARIEAHGGRYLLYDVSTNGTYLLDAGGGEPRYVRRNHAELASDGWIGLGRAPVQGAPHSVRFQCVNSKEE